MDQGNVNNGVIVLIVFIVDVTIIIVRFGWETRIFMVVCTTIFFILLLFVAQCVSLLLPIFFHLYSSRNRQRKSYIFERQTNCVTIFFTISRMTGVSGSFVKSYIYVRVQDYLFLLCQTSEVCWKKKGLPLLVVSFGFVGGDNRYLIRSFVLSLDTAARMDFVRVIFWSHYALLHFLQEEYMRVCEETRQEQSGKTEIHKIEKEG